MGGKLLKRSLNCWRKNMIQSLYYRMIRTIQQRYYVISYDSSVTTNFLGIKNEFCFIDNGFG